MRHLLRAFGYAWKGLFSSFVSERNMKLHALAALLVIVLGFYCRVSLPEWTALSLCIGVVFVTELINTAIEKLTDLVSPEHDPRAGAVKDIAAGAVLFAAITAIVVGSIIFIPKFL